MRYAFCASKPTVCHNPDGLSYTHAGTVSHSKENSHSRYIVQLLLNLKLSSASRRFWWTCRPFTYLNLPPCIKFEQFRHAIIIFSQANVCMLHIIRPPIWRIINVPNCPNTYFGVWAGGDKTRQLCDSGDSLTRCCIWAPSPEIL